MKKPWLWTFSWDYGRGGSVEGIFIAPEAEVKKAIGMNVYFGEILGKHSEVQGVIEEKDLKQITDDKHVIKIIKDHLNGGTGYNPLHYLVCEHGIHLSEEECDECDE